jgi:hypothetical protein
VKFKVLYTAKLYLCENVKDLDKRMYIGSREHLSEERALVPK